MKKQSVMLVMAAVILAIGSTDVKGSAFSDDFSDGVIDEFWNAFYDIPGSEISEAGGKLTISVPADQSDYFDTGLESASVYSCEGQGFESSVDFRVPEGISNSMAWLSASFHPQGPSSGIYGVYPHLGTSYNIWYRNEDGYGWEYGMDTFSDEDTAWHTLKLVYDADTVTASAYVDNIFLNSKTVDLTNFRVAISAKASLNTGPFTVEFDNFQIVPEPTTVALLGLGSLSLLRRRKK